MEELCASYLRSTSFETFVFRYAAVISHAQALGSNRVTDALATATSLAEEKLASIRTVRSFAQERRETGEYATRVQSVLELANRVALISGGFFSGTFFAVNLSLLAVLYHGATIVMSGGMTAGDLTSFLLYAIYVGFAFSGVGSFYGELMRSLGSSDRVLSLLDRRPDEKSTSGTRTLSQLAGSISFKDINFTYPTRLEHPILKQFNLHLEPGSVVAIVGHSGSGKSTIFSLLTRLYEANSGTILVDGIPHTEIDAGWLRDQFGLVPQDVNLFAATIRQNIAYGKPSATEEDIITAAKEANAHDFIMKFPQGYETQVGERGVTLSGGQKQRIAIARALIKNPKVLLLDEATSSLDTESEYLIQQALQRLMKGRTVLIIAHRLSTIKNADRIAVLVNGSVAEQGTFDELMSQKGPFKQLVDRQDY
jgi:ATP-binding cassette, subfamily B (MDR/TAP), member 10